MPDNKGTAYSPLVVAGLILFSALASIYLSEMQRIHLESVRLEAEVSQSALDLAAARISAGTAARSLYLSKGPNATAEELEAGLDGLLAERGLGELSSINGSFSVSLRRLPGGRMLISTEEAPVACVGTPHGGVCSQLGVEEVV